MGAGLGNNWNIKIRWNITFWNSGQDWIRFEFLDVLKTRCIHPCPKNKKEKTSF
jgi:hypothetical protein